MPKDTFVREWKRESTEARESLAVLEKIMRKVKKYDFWNKSKLQFIFLKKKIFFYEKIN